MIKADANKPEFPCFSSSGNLTSQVPAETLSRAVGLLAADKPDFSPLSWPDDYMMSRAQAEALSRAVGLPVAKQYLAKLHCVPSNGPPTVHFGRKVRLRVGDVKRWLNDRVSAPRRSTSEADGQPKVSE